MNKNEEVLIGFLIEISLNLNLTISFKEMCLNLSDSALFYILDLDVKKSDWQIETINNIIAERVYLVLKAEKDAGM